MMLEDLILRCFVQVTSSARCWASDTFTARDAVQVSA